MNTSADAYFIDGCGRCELGGTPQCKVHKWYKILIKLREIVLNCGLTEECKWGMPCYTYDGNNILIISAFKESCTLNFFKGSLLSDTHKMLVKPGENSQSAMFLRFTDIKEVSSNHKKIKEYIFEAIEVEKSGLKVDFKQKDELVYSDELLQQFKLNIEFKKAFEALTPGRQRGYILFFTSPKQSKTRTTRIEKSIKAIMQGKGIHD